MTTHQFFLFPLVFWGVGRKFIKGSNGLCMIMPFKLKCLSPTHLT